MRTKLGLCILTAAMTAGAYALGLSAQAEPSASGRSLIAETISDDSLVTLTHNTRPEAMVATNDRGRMSDNVHLGGLQLLLRRSDAQETAFDKVLSDLHNPKSPSFHHWLTNAEVGERFGLGQEDMNKITGWLDSHGLHVDGIQPDHTFVSFSGSAGAVSSTFHTEIHYLTVNGEQHFANMSDPRIPAALAGAVAGVVAIHDFHGHPNAIRKMTKSSAALGPHKNGTGGSGSSQFQYITPADLATIYDFKSVLNSGITGQGQTVVVVEDTNLYKVADWSIFRAVMGLSGYTHGSLTQAHPQGAAVCATPTVNGDEDEATIDVDYATASAPNAAIVMASCTDTGPGNVGFGGLKAIQNMIAPSNHPTIFSMSYGECEAANGATANAAFNTTMQTAASEGVSVFVSSGDESAVSCDSNRTAATHGIGVSGWMSSPWDISVGGTDFADFPMSCPISGYPANYPQCVSQYWNSTNSAGFESAKSYIPEIPWDDSCASSVWSNWEGFPAHSTPSTASCNFSGVSSSGLLTTGSGSGGPSGCATGTPATASEVGGSCAGWPKPDYQQLGTQGSVADGVRDTPDVALFASNGFWNHYYPICDSNPSLGTGGGCLTANPFNWAGFGGTSVSTPIWAGIQALVNQKTGQSWGNVNEQLYAFAHAEYGSSGNANCNSSTSPSSHSAACVFHDLTSGDFDVNCTVLGRAPNTTTHNCLIITATGANGLGSLSNSAFQDMYAAAPGWDFTSGNGTPDVANLLKAFAALPAPT